MQSLRTAFKEAAWVFVPSRLVILFITYISVIMLPQHGQAAPLDCTHGIHPNPCLFGWFHWDAVAYVRIAHQGYSSTPDVAWFPLWPLLEHFAGLLLGGYFPFSYYLAGLLLANICFYFALVLFYYLLCEEFEPTLAKRALFYLAFYPYALFFFAGYTESLFLLLGLAIFLLLRRGRTLDWWLAGVLGFLAVLTRSSGIALVVPFLVIYIQRFWTASERKQHSWFQKLNALAPIALIPAGILAYMLYLGYTKGNPLIFVSEEATYNWHRHFAFIWNAFGPAIGALFTQPLLSASFLQNLLDISFTLIPLSALLLGWRRIPLHYSLFAAALAIFSLSFPQVAEPLASQPRYMMSMFPIFAIFALWGKRPGFDRWYIAFSLPLLAINSVLFISHYWVA